MTKDERCCNYRTRINEGRRMDMHEPTCPLLVADERERLLYEWGYAAQVREREERARALAENGGDR